MGQITTKLKKRLQNFNQKKVVQVSQLLDGKRIAQEASYTIAPFDELVKKGYDPLPALYVNAQNLLSFFAEQISPLPELK